MAVFSTNQNRQLYVVETFKDSVEAVKSAEVKNAPVATGSDKEGNLYAVVKDHGGIQRTDLINPKSIMWANAAAPADMQHILKVVALELADAAKDGNNPIAGQDYIVRVNFRQMYGMSDEDIYQKYGAVHTYTGMTASNFYKEMIYSLVKNFSRLYQPLIDIAANSATNVIVKAVKLNGEVKLYNASGEVASVTKIYFVERSQADDWVLGTKQIVPVYFDIIPTTITDASNSEIVWGKQSDETLTSGNPTVAPVGNGYNIADLEYFCMGERGDQYRNVLWPKSIPTKYLVDPTAEYYVLDIHYAYQGTCEDIQKSEKTMTFVSTDSGVLDSIISGFGITNVVKKTANYEAATTDDGD